MFQDKIKKIISNIEPVLEVAIQKAIAAIEAKSTQRIFKQGLAKDEKKIGTYSESYKNTRKKKGLQTAFVDLTNTTSLLQSVAKNDTQVFFKNEYGRKISGYNETHFKKRVFAPTQTERELALEIINDELKQLWKS